MDTHNENLCKGLHLMYLGSIIAIAALICALLTARIPLLPIVLLFTGVGGPIASAVGLVKIRREHADYVYALIALAISFLCGLLSSSLDWDNRFVILRGIVKPIASLVEYYFVIRATSSFLREGGFIEQVTQGGKVWKLQLICVAGSVALTAIAMLGVSAHPVLMMVALVGGLILMVLSIYALVLYLGYLNDSSKVL